MTVFNSSTYAAESGTPPILATPTTKDRVFYAEYDIAAVTGYAATDTINMFVLPAGWVIIGGFAECDDLLTTATSPLIDIGTAGNADALIDGLDPETADFQVALSAAASVGLAKSSSDTTIIATLAGTWTAAIVGAQLRCWFHAVRSSVSP